VGEEGKRGGSFLTDIDRSREGVVKAGGGVEERSGSEMTEE
jgi:hypothetical protein